MANKKKVPGATRYKLSLYNCKLLSKIKSQTLDPGRKMLCACLKENQPARLLVYSTNKSLKIVNNLN